MRDYGTEFDDRGGMKGTASLFLIGAGGVFAILIMVLLAMFIITGNGNSLMYEATAATPTIAPTPAPTIAPTPKPTATPKPTPEPKYFDARKYGGPGNMVEDPKYKGVYLGNLGGLVAFIDIEAYLYNGGVCRTGNMIGIPLYTRFGLDPQSFYEPNTGIVWSLIEEPWTMELYNEKRGALGYT